MSEKICEHIRECYKQLDHLSTLSKTGTPTNHKEQSRAQTYPLTSKDSHPKYNSDHTSTVTGLSSNNSNPSYLLFFDEDEEAAIKLKKKSAPKRDNGMCESFVALRVKGSKETTPQNNLHTALVKVVTVMHSVDGKTSFQCVYEDSSACWIDPGANKITSVTPIKRPEDVPMTSGMLEKYFKVQWDRMMTDQRGEKEKHDKPWKQLNIAGTLLLSSIVCDGYLCSKVVSILGSEGIRLVVKQIQVPRTVVIACLICVSNLVDLVAVKAILAKLCVDTELLTISKFRHKAPEGDNFPGFQLSRRPAR